MLEYSIESQHSYRLCITAHTLQKRRMTNAEGINPPNVLTARIRNENRKSKLRKVRITAEVRCHS